MIAPSNPWRYCRKRPNPPIPRFLRWALQPHRRIRGIGKAGPVGSKYPQIRLRENRASLEPFLRARLWAETRMFQTSADDFIPKPQEPVRTGGLSLGRGGIKLKKKQQE